MYKMVNLDFWTKSTAASAPGRKSGGGAGPSEVVLKVFKTTLNEFKNRDRYIKDDYRFKERFSNSTPGNLRSGDSLSRRGSSEEHILVMSFIGADHVPAPKLKDVILSEDE
ncbi:hypothetical protein WMY93_034411 [Mugilogobius chulae]|uniref:non-specific serine/threonine protein kinase n=1 Tax=Mugilogobius chulae TaxID=88201 RepID=A0AAW0MEY8_9GOBI